MTALITDRMSREERRAGISLAAVFALRMLGLFLILPVFAIHARELPSGDDAALVGMALGAYGLTQACLQIAYGAASDRFGRKPVIVVGLLLFAAGSFVAAGASDIYLVIVGRVLQGSGAISAAVTALAADLTREQHLTKVMAMIGSSIGLMFALSMVAAPLLYSLVGMSGIFALTGVLALLAIALVLKVVPAAPMVPRQPAWPSFIEVLTDGRLQRLNFGVLALHLMLTAMWVVLPAELVQAGGLPVSDHWQVYLPALLLSFLVMVPAIVLAERFAHVKLVFNLAIGMLIVVEAGFGLFANGLHSLFVCLTLFFTAFNVLEAMQPSLISRIAPSHAKGAALGIYNTTQAIGLFLGGVIGGTLAKNAGALAVWTVGAALAAVWLILGLTLPASALRRPEAAGQKHL
ncbi:MFS transporter [Accumulibacter sp.]|uniref:MFS transporter n=1 Tax=Accumulibacter sp. TaxID=2053492 RepID=UPI0025F99376|nr:MFS transporter [Accumulibacter sp.]MCM8594208.1 MFS transporter [Accumulibacter sp.]MDS4048351.1 MFS transporter [Accumulibacter sp.]